MSTIIDPVERHDDSAEPPEAPEQEQQLEVRRDGPLSLLVGACAGVLAVAFLLRGVGSGSLLDWALFAATGVIAAMHLAAVIDARAPLFVLDTLGVRVRRGAAWQGVSWPEVDHVEHHPRTSTLRDGSLTVVTVDGRRLGVRLSLSTRLVGADWHEVDEALVELSGGRVPVLDRRGPAEDPNVTDVAEGAAQEEEPEESPESPESLGVEAVAETAPAEHGEPDETPAETEEVATEDTSTIDVQPQRESRPARRSEVVAAPRVLADTEDIIEPETELSLPRVPTEEQTVVLGPDDLLPGPVVGPQLAAARARVGISVEALAERTRIRPHVIEAIERDDFESCGGDFYARGHLRTLSRMLGVDATELVALYDERYAHAPIDARRVFEAELASGPTGSPGSRRLNWSVLVAAVMAVVLVWSVARLVMDGPVPLSDQPVLNGSPGGKATLSGATSKVPVTLTAATGGARVIVRDSRQQVVFDAELAFMQTAELSVAPPVRISTTDGGLVVSVDGADEGPMGATGQDAQRTYVP